MLARLIILLLTAGLVGTQPAPSQPLRSGILIVPFEDTRSMTHGRAGDLIRFRDSPDGVSFDIEYQDSTYNGVWSVRLIPFDSTFAPQYVYSVLDSEKELLRGGEQDLQDRADLATRAREMFAYHPYGDHFACFACRAAHEVESHETDGKTSWPKSRACVETYLRSFPTGQHRDEMEWLQVRLENAVYEFEGYPKLAIEQLDAFTSYLDKHPRQSMRTEIEFAQAQLCYIIYEMSVTESPVITGFTAEEGKPYRARVEEIYERLSVSADPAVASRAIVMLYNLRDGRRIYVNPNEWWLH